MLWLLVLVLVLVAVAVAAAAAAAAVVFLSVCVFDDFHALAFTGAKGWVDIIYSTTSQLPLKLKQSCKPT